MRLDVKMFRDGRPVALAHTRDVGLEGAFVECPGVALAGNTFLELAFESGSRGTRRLYRIPVRVSRVATEGFGVVFWRFDRSLFRDLERLLYSPDGLAQERGSS